MVVQSIKLNQFSDVIVLLVFSFKTNYIGILMTSYA